MRSGPFQGLVVTLSLILAAAAQPAAAVGPDWASFKAVPYEPPKSAPEFSLPALVFFWATW